MHVYSCELELKSIIFCTKTRDPVGMVQTLKNDRKNMLEMWIDGKVSDGIPAVFMVKLNWWTAVYPNFQFHAIFQIQTGNEVVRQISFDGYSTIGVASFCFVDFQSQRR